MLADDFTITTCPCVEEVVRMDPIGATRRIAFLKDMAMTI